MCVIIITLLSRQNIISECGLNTSDTSGYIYDNHGIDISEQTWLNYNATAEQVLLLNGSTTQLYIPPANNSFGENLEVSTKFMLAVFVSHICLWQPLIMLIIHINIIWKTYETINKQEKVRMWFSFLFFFWRICWHFLFVFERWCIECSKFVGCLFVLLFEFSLCFLFFVLVLLVVVGMLRRKTVQHKHQKLQPSQTEYL